ncbi:hypothetical protein C8T65DRAFT_828566 [Cerioporus squamosus]|nr:hypothetical protein C8T65DRAFT_828566 [Cerioporus squamosus]
MEGELREKQLGALLDALRELVPGGRRVDAQLQPSEPPGRCLSLRPRPTPAFDMWLLNTANGEFVGVIDPREVKYAALSHVWSRDPRVPELSFHDLLKIQEEVRIARSEDPTIPEDAVLLRASEKSSSSAELEEAINSMYSWYSSSTVCYAFLQDVDGREDPRASNSSFRRSEWHNRGWTLQELVAPRVVVFLSRTWRYIGAKHGMANLIEDVTGVDRDVVLGSKPVSSVSVARRMSWASRRVTTRREDEAYCLMGIFSVNMPVIYGEGPAAFVRLQEEILKYIPDQSIFVWSRTVPIDPSAQAIHREAFFEGTGTHHTLLAPSPALFLSSRNVISITKGSLARILGIAIPPPTYTITSYGLRVTLPLLSITGTIRVALLASQWNNDYLLGLVLKKTGVSDIYSVGVPSLSPRVGLPGEWEAGFSFITEHGSRSWCMVRLPPVSDGRTCILASDLPTRPFIGEIHIVHRPTIPQPRPAVGPGLSISPQAYKVEVTEGSQDHLASLGLQISASRSMDWTTIIISATNSHISLVLSRCDYPTSDLQELYRFATQVTVSWNREAVLPVDENTGVDGSVETLLHDKSGGLSVPRMACDKEPISRQPEVHRELQQLFNPANIQGGSNTQYFEGFDMYIELNMYNLRKALNQDFSEVAASDEPAFDIPRMCVGHKVTVIIEIMGCPRYTRQISIRGNTARAESGITRRQLAERLVQLLGNYVAQQPIRYADRQLSMDDLVLLGLRRVFRSCWILVAAAWDSPGGVASEQMVRKD